MQGRLALNAGIFYACKDIGYIVPPRISLMGIQHQWTMCYAEGKAIYPFFIHSLNA